MIWVTDCVHGRPAEGVAIELQQRADGVWETLGTAHTDQDGRIHNVPHVRALGGGVYRLVCDLDRYFATMGVTPSIPRITVEFRAFDSETESRLHIHVAPHGHQICKVVT